MRAFLFGAILLLVSCAPGPARQGQSDTASPGRAAAPKTLRIGSINEPVSGLALFAGSGEAASQITSIFHAGLTTYDSQANIVPRIAQKVPSIDDGDWKIFPDGSMEVTWKVRPNVRWHDGTALTAEDFVLGIQIARDAEIPLPHQGGVPLVNEVSAPDSATLVLRWSKSYYAANVANLTDFPAVPRHIVGDLYRQSDRQAFINSPYWASEFVGLGPYKLGQWMQGSQTEALAFDDYFLGRPTIDRLIIRYYLDINTMVAALLAGDYDVETINLRMNDLSQVIDVFEARGGKLITSLVDVAWARLQFRDPEAPWVRDVRVRRALSHLIDKQALADAFSPEGGPADLFASTGDPAFQIAEQRGFMKYPYDVTRATSLLGEAGWTRGPDGMFQNSAGQRFNIEVRVVSRDQEGLALADQWKRGGLNAETYIMGKALSSRTDLKAANKGLFWMADTLKPDTFEFFRTAQIVSEQNGWSGRNLGGYSNPEYDRVYDQLTNELNPAGFQSQYADLLRWTAQELPFLTAYYEVSQAITALRSGVRGPGPILALSKVATWNINEWDVD